MLLARKQIERKRASFFSRQLLVSYWQELQSRSSEDSKQWTPQRNVATQDKVSKLAIYVTAMLAPTLSLDLICLRRWEI